MVKISFFVLSNCFYTLQGPKFPEIQINAKYVSIFVSGLTNPTIIYSTGESKEHHRTEKRIELTKRTTQKTEIKVTTVQSSGMYHRSSGQPAAVTIIMSKSNSIHPFLTLFGPLQQCVFAT
jgi:hypothetical protein